MAESFPIFLLIALVYLGYKFPAVIVAYIILGALSYRLMKAWNSIEDTNGEEK